MRLSERHLILSPETVSSIDEEEDMHSLGLPKTREEIHLIPRLKPQAQKPGIPFQKDDFPRHFWVFGPLGSETKSVAHELNRLLGYPAKEIDIMSLIGQHYHRRLSEFSPIELQQAEDQITTEIAFNGTTTIAKIEDEYAFSLSALEMMRKNGVIISLEESDPTVLAHRILMAKNSGQQIPPTLTNLSKPQLIEKLKSIYQAQKDTRKIGHLHIKIGTVPINAVVAAILKSKSVKSFLS